MKINSLYKIKPNHYHINGLGLCSFMKQDSIDFSHSYICGQEDIFICLGSSIKLEHGKIIRTVYHFYCITRNVCLDCSPQTQDYSNVFVEYIQ